MNITVGVTADDFGYCQRRNKAVVELCRYGVIGRLSLIVNATECCDAVSTFRELPMESKSSIKVGLHLNLTEGRPIAKPSFVQSLVDDNGNFLGKMGLREKLATVSESEVAQEIRSQVERFKNLMGCLPAYVDGHQHVHVCPSIRDAFADALCSYGILTTRIPVELGIERCSWINDSQSLFFRSVCEDASVAKEIFTKSGLRFPDYFVGLSTMGKNMTGSKVRVALEYVLKASVSEEDLRNGTHFRKSCAIEFMTHPGFQSQAGEGGCGLGPDEFSMSHEREIEYEYLRDKLKDTLSKLDLKLGTF